VEKVMPADVFRLMYAGCGTNYRRPWCVDVRAGKEFKKSHLAHAFNIALSKNGKILAVRPRARLQASATEGWIDGRQLLQARGPSGAACCARSVVLLSTGNADEARALS
jgi:hypothetical protein